MTAEKLSNRLTDMAHELGDEAVAEGASPRRVVLELMIGWDIARRQRGQAEDVAFRNMLEASQMLEKIR